MSQNRKREITIVPLREVHPSEADWLRVLFDGFDVNWLDFRKETPFFDNALYLYNDHRALDLPETVMRELQSLKGCGLIHLGDEFARSSLKAYANFDYVLRTFPFSKTNNPGVYGFPVGYTNNLGDRSDKPASIRQHTWMFAGDWKADRSLMANAFKNVPGGLLSLTRNLAGEKRMPREEYLSSMADCVFVPCPSGNVLLETCRAYEALHFGAIPLLPKRKHRDVYLEFFGPHPIPTFATWPEAAKFVRDLIIDPKRCDALQIECIEWWDTIQKKWQEEIVEFVLAGQNGEFTQTLKSNFTGHSISSFDRFHNLLQQQTTQQIWARVGRSVALIGNKVGINKGNSSGWSIHASDGKNDLNR
ncbi:MAG: hypothetical protein AAGJ68_01125 [Pseudomonadota bacterium]